MWLVRVALNRTYTFVVMALLILFGGVFTIARMPKRTLVPTLVQYLLGRDHHRAPPATSILGRATGGFDAAFGKLQRAYARLLERALARPRAVLLTFGALVAMSLGVSAFIGRDKLSSFCCSKARSRNWFSTRTRTRAHF